MDGRVQEEKKKAAKRKVPVQLDPDKLGLLGALFFATVVMALGFYYRKLPMTIVMFRVVVTFAVSYVAVFLLTLLLIRVARIELAEEEPSEEIEEQEEGIGDAIDSLTPEQLAALMDQMKEEEAGEV